MILASTIESLIFDNWLAFAMADAMFMYGVVAGIFAFLVAILFGSRAAHKRGRSEDPGGAESHSHASNASGNEGKRVKKFKSDGTPVYE